MSASTQVATGCVVVVAGGVTVGLISVVVVWVVVDTGFKFDKPPETLLTVSVEGCGVVVCSRIGRFLDFLATFIASRFNAGHPFTSFCGTLKASFLFGNVEEVPPILTFMGVTFDVSDFAPTGIIPVVSTLPEISVGNCFSSFPVTGFIAIISF